MRRCNLVMLYHWHWLQCHMMLMASSMAPFHSLCQNDWNEMQHDFLVMCCHWHWHKQHVMLMAMSVTPLHLLGQDDWNEVEHDFSGHVMSLPLMLSSHAAISIVKGTIVFLTSRQSKLEAAWLFWACHTIAIGFTWCHWCWCHMMPLVSVSVLHEAYRIINGTIIIFRSRW